MIRRVVYVTSKSDLGNGASLGEVVDEPHLWVDSLKNN